MKEAVITFIKGMNTDLDNSVFQQGMYRNASNLRLGNMAPAASGNVAALENVQGNELVLDSPLYIGTILGQVNVRDWLILFIKIPEHKPNPETFVDAHDAIYKLRLNEEGNSVAEFQLIYSDLNSTSKLNFNEEHKIIAIGRHETSELNKVYWVDGLNPIRYIDINKDYLSTSTEASLLDIVPPYQVSAPSVTEIVDGGNYLAGVVQYSYQLYGKNGASTAFSPLSNLVKLSSKSQYVEGGSEKDENTGKAVKVVIPTTGYDSRYDRVRIVAIHYTTINALPSINIVAEYQNTQGFTFIDTGRVINNITVEEFTSFAETTYVPKTIESKDNYLFAANIREEAFDSEILDNWDARAYRFLAANSQHSVLKLTDFIKADSGYLLFTRPLVIRQTPLAGIDGSSPWSSFWFYSDNKIYINAPMTAQSDIVQNSELELVNTINVQSIFSYNEFTQQLSFGNRQIHCNSTVEIQNSFDFPVGWNSTAWNSGTGFPVATISKIYNSSGASRIITSSDISQFPNNWGIPVEFDAINYYNKLTPTAPETFNRTSNGVMFGGEGPNVSYSFSFEQEDIDNEANETVKIGITKPSTTASVGGQAGEVYRIGIGFINAKGQTSFIKWVGDIKFPEYSEIPSQLYGHAFASSINSVIIANKIKLTVTLKNPPADSNLQGWQIFRVKREQKDRSVLYSGVLSPTFRRKYFLGIETEDFARPASFISGGKYTAMYPISKGNTSTLDAVFTSGTYPDKIVEFISPDINFFKPSIELEGLTLRVGHVIKQYNTDYTLTSQYSHVVGFSKLGEVERLYTDNNVRTTPTFLNYEVVDFKYVTPVYEASKEITIISGDSYKNQLYVIRNSTNDRKFGARGSGIMLKLNEGLYQKLKAETNNYFGVASPENQYLYGRLLRDVTNTRYGGITYQARFNSEYIPYSTYVPITETTVSCDFGDNYITMFQFMRGLWWDTVDGNGDQSVQESLAFPAESSVDIRYRLDELQRYVSDGSSWKFTNFILDTMTPQEQVEKGIQLQPDSYDPAIGDLYRYNSVYSTGPEIKKYYPKPFDFDELQKNDVKIIVSEKKYNGEYADNWTVFKPGNFIEVDTKYGPVNALRHFNGAMLFWQDRAFGALGVNERSLISDNNPGQLSLGTGGVLERYDYTSTEIGCTNHFSLVNSDSSLYWYDRFNHQLLELSDRLKYLDLEKGIKTYLRTLPKTDEVLVEVDKDNREVVFAFPGKDVLVYNQLIEAFLGTFTYEPYMMFRDYGDRLFTVPKNAKYEVYKHNSPNVNRGTFYDEQSYSTVTILVNQEFDSIKVFDNIAFPSVSQLGEVNIFDNTFDELIAYNSYQHTGSYSLIKGGTYSDIVLPLERRERMWRTFIPRNSVSQDVSDNPDIQNPINLNKSAKFKDRMRDNYLAIMLKYNNDSGNYFSVPYVKILYRNSTR